MRASANTQGNTHRLWLFDVSHYVFASASEDMCLFSSTFLFNQEDSCGFPTILFSPSHLILKLKKLAVCFPSVWKSEEIGTLSIMLKEQIQNWGCLLHFCVWNIVSSYTAYATHIN